MITPSQLSVSCPSLVSTPPSQCLTQITVSLPTFLSRIFINVIVYIMDNILPWGPTQPDCKSCPFPVVSCPIYWIVFDSLCSHFTKLWFYFLGIYVSSPAVGWCWMLMACSRWLLTGFFVSLWMNYRWGANAGPGRYIPNPNAGTSFSTVCLQIFPCMWPMLVNRPNGTFSSWTISNIPYSSKALICWKHYVYSHYLNL